MGKKKNNDDPMYTRHGKKRNLGKPIMVNGNKALAYIEGNEIVGYSTLDEIHKEFYTKELEEYDLSI